MAPRRRRRSGGALLAKLASGVLLTAILAVMFWQGWQVYQQDQRERAAWRRVGSCEPVGTTDEVACTGVELVELRLPPEIASCGENGICSVKVNQEALPAFREAVAEVVAQGLGSYVPQFQTVNKRRCRDGRTGEWIPNCVSKHSYGIAVDFRPFADNSNWETIVDRDPGVAEVVEIFRKTGFRWGGTFDNYDPQHLEWIPR